jgi:hypothetical protein
VGLISKILRSGEGGRLTWWCPGCRGPHAVQHGDGPGPRWTWNGDAARPTFSPSVLVTWREPANDGDALDRDILAHVERGVPIPARDRVCHSFVVDGRMQMLGDCTHALAGQTVDIPEWPWQE